jgi:hypothetical protein
MKTLSFAVVQKLGPVSLWTSLESSPIVGSCPSPCDLVDEIRRAENFIHHASDETVHSPITMDINAPVFYQQIPHQDQSLVDHGDKAVRPFPLGVTVRDLL